MEEIGIHTYISSIHSHQISQQQPYWMFDWTKVNDDELDCNLVAWRNMFSRFRRINLRYVIVQLRGLDDIETIDTNRRANIIDVDQ